MLLGDHCYCPKQRRFFKFLTLKIFIELIIKKLKTEEKKKKIFYKHQPSYTNFVSQFKTP